MAIATQMRFDTWHARGLSASRSLLGNQHPTRVQIAKVENGACSAEFGKNVREIADSVCETIAATINDATKQLSFLVPSAVGMPRCGVLNHNERVRCRLHRATLPRQRFTDEF